MIGIVFRRLIALVAIVIGVTLVTFLIARVIPGDPALLLAGPNATPEVVAKIHEQLGLDRPLYVQYASYLDSLIHGDFGVSIVTRRPVIDEITSLLPATLELMATAMILGLFGGVSLGVAAALYRNRWLDHVIRILSVTAISMPGFWVALVLLYVFYGVLGWAPGPGRFDPLLTPPPSVTGFLLLDSLIALDVRAFASAASHLALPAITLAILSIGGGMRLVRGSMIEALSQDYIRTARAFGLPERKIVLSYALKNALLPFITVFGLELASLIFGSVVIESIFSWPGLGSFVLSAIFALDFPVIMGFTVCASVVYVFANLIVDVVYVAFDPRVRGIG